MIFDTPPRDWKHLEEMVNQAFDEMGYESYRDHELSTVRGTVRIDVYAVKTSSPIPTIVLCECKYWEKPVSQNVIYGFRSICADVGAHFGLIISKAGFQSGAKETRDATNIHLLSFSEFESTFFEEWRTGVFLKLGQMCDSLLPLLPGNPDFVDNRESQKKLGTLNVFDKYNIFFGSQRYTSYFIERGEFPIVITDPRGDPNKLETLTIQSRRQYFEIAKQACIDARKYFHI